MQIGIDTSGIHVPLWFNAVQRKNYPVLDKNIQTEVCIIGAGISGLSVAYHLLRAGKQVVVIEDGRVGSGETGRTTAHLSNALDDRYSEIEKIHGLSGAKLAAASHTAAIDNIETIINTENIDCDFIRIKGYLFSGANQPQDILQQEIEAAHRAGLTDVQWLSNPPVDSLTQGPCLVFPNQAQFHPLKYLTQLAQAITKMGGKIFEQTRAVGIEQKSPLVITTSAGSTTTANVVVVAANAPLFSKMVMHTKQEANRTYVISVAIPKNSIPMALYWDTVDPYHYVRLHKAEDAEAYDILIVGGEDHRTGQHHLAEEAFLRLEAWARDHFPQLENIIYRWSGQVLEPVDYMGFIGRYPTMDKNIYLVTGDSGNGMTHGALAGILLTDLILERENPWAALYDPARKTLKTCGAFAHHNLASMAGYISYLTPGELDSVNEVPPNTGAIIRQGLNKLAVYRDENNRLH
jgi:glycine/D-amino acid oxidase-like deaminating enzyme